VHMQHMVLSLSTRVSGGLSVNNMSERCSPVLAYVDDITVLVTRPEDFGTIGQAVHT